jgi:hypothetical protein
VLSKTGALGVAGALSFLRGGVCALRLLFPPYNPLFILLIYIKDTLRHPEAESHAALGLERVH